nr:PREDICTED: serine/arginine repetitive matrix protein 2-like isoform X2 [Bemisia tabaci]
MSRGRELSKDEIEHRLRNNDLFLDDIGSNETESPEVKPPTKRPVGRGFHSGGLFPGGHGLVDNRFKLNPIEESSIRDRLSNFKKSVETSLYDEDDDVNIDKNSLLKSNNESVHRRLLDNGSFMRKVELLNTQEENEIAVRLNSLAEEVMAEKAPCAAIFPNASKLTEPDIFPPGDDSLSNHMSRDKSSTFDIFQSSDGTCDAPKEPSDEARSLIDRLMFEKNQLEAELLRQKQKSAGMNKTESSETHKKVEAVDTLKLNQPPPPGSIKARLGGYVEEPNPVREERIIIRDSTENRENRSSQKYSSRHKPDDKHHNKVSRHSPPRRTNIRSKSPLRRNDRSPPSRNRSPLPFRPRSPKRNRSRSPRRNRSRSPRRRSRSPRRRSKSPIFRGKSPRRRSKSPRHRSKSPRHRSKSPRHGLRPKSPKRRSKSPRLGSKSPRRSKSPRGRYRTRSRSYSPSPGRSPSRKFKRDVVNPELLMPRNPLSPNKSNDQWMRPSNAPDPAWKGAPINSFNPMNVPMDIPPPNFEQPPPMYNYPPQDFGNPAVRPPPLSNFPSGHFDPTRPYFPGGPGQQFVPNEGFSGQNRPPGWNQPPGPGPLGPMNVPPPFVPSGPPPSGPPSSSLPPSGPPPSCRSNLRGPAPQPKPVAPPPQKMMEEDKKKKAVESELLEQRRSLALQRKEYFKKASTIKDELGKLKRQQIELSHEKSGSEVDKILKQNKKFQSELQNKLKGIDNIIDMLSGIIGDTKDLDLEEKEPTPPGHASYILEPPPKKEPRIIRSSPAANNAPKPDPPSRSMVLNLDPSPSPGSDFDSFKFTSQKSIEVQSPQTPAKFVTETSNDAWEPEFIERPKSPLGQRLAAINPMVDPPVPKVAQVSEPAVPNLIRDAIEIKTPPPPIFMAMEPKAPSPPVTKDSPSPKPHRNKIAPIFDPNTLPTPKPPQVTQRNPDSPVVVLANSPASQAVYAQPQVQPQPSKQQALVANQPEAPGTHKPLVNYIHYDPEIHWCKVCNVFPRTAKEYLNHLHAPEHKKTLMEKNMFDAPWHKAFPPEEISPNYPGAPTKRVPIRGLPFFVSSAAWYCKLCNVWIGDLHCASLHLKSINHASKYSDFTEQNPHWEVDWLADRTRAYEISTEMRRQEETEKLAQIVLAPTNHLEAVKPTPSNPEADIEAEKKKKILELIAAIEENKKEILKVKKKRARSSSSDSSSSSSSSSSSGGNKRSSKSKTKSIRVAMRNRASKHSKRESSPPRSLSPNMKPKKNRNATPSDDKEDKMIKEWMTTSDKDLKESVSSLKDRIKSKQESKSKPRYEKSKHDEKNEKSRERNERNERKRSTSEEKSERRSSSSKVNEKDNKRKHDLKEDRKKEEKDDRKRSDDKENRKKTEEKDVRKKYKGDTDKEGGKDAGSSTKSPKGGKSETKASSESDKTNKTAKDESPFEAVPKQESTPFGTKPIKKQINIKMKLPFIGRMPFHKKLGGKAGTKEDKDEDQGDDAKNKTSKEVVNEKLTKIATSLGKFAPDGTLIDPVQAEIQSIMEEKVKEVTSKADSTKKADKSDVEDMDLANENSDDESNLPRDLQTALDIIFPEEEKSDTSKESKVNVSTPTPNSTTFFGPQSEGDLPSLPPSLPPPSSAHPTPVMNTPLPGPGFPPPQPMMQGVPPPILGPMIVPAPPMMMSPPGAPRLPPRGLPRMGPPGAPRMGSPGPPRMSPPGPPRMSPPGPPRMSPPGPPRMRPPGPPRQTPPRMGPPASQKKPPPKPKPPTSQSPQTPADSPAVSEDGSGDSSKEGQPEVKKRRNPLSQKKRRALKKLREKLEAQEKQLQEQLQTLQGDEAKVENNVTVENKKEESEVEQGKVDLDIMEIPIPVDPPKKLIRNDSDELALLGIDASDSHF